MSQSRISICVIAGTILAFASFLSARAEEVTEPADEPGSRVYELQDVDTDTPPVNYRSNEDERYDTPAQHDAEMYAEQYERERQEKAIKDEQLLRNIDGFAAGAPYTPGLGDSSYR